MQYNAIQQIETLRELIAKYGEQAPSKGRPVTAFTTDLRTGTFHRATRDAYTLRFLHFKILTAMDHGMPCVDPAREAPNGSARRTLWLYMHHCLPECPGKEAELRALHDLHNANKLMLGIEQMILRKLAAGEITDAGYAATVRDEARFLSFATDWFSRPVGSRAKARKCRA